MILTNQLTDQQSDLYEFNLMIIWWEEQNGSAIKHNLGGKKLRLAITLLQFLPLWLLIYYNQKRKKKKRKKSYLQWLFIWDRERGPRKLCIKSFKSFFFQTIFILEEVYWYIYVNFKVCKQNSIIRISWSHHSMNFGSYKNKKKP